MHPPQKLTTQLPHKSPHNAKTVLHRVAYSVSSLYHGRHVFLANLDARARVSNQSAKWGETLAMMGEFRGCVAHIGDSVQELYEVMDAWRLAFVLHAQRLQVLLWALLAVTSDYLERNSYRPT